MIHPVPRDDVPRVWAEVRELLLPAIERYGDGRWAEYDVLAGLMAGHLQLWAADGGACVTQPQQFPRKKVLGLLFVGGRHRENWMQHLKAIEQWAHTQGFDNVDGYARKGWLRNLMPGFRITYTHITKAL